MSIADAFRLRAPLKAVMGELRGAEGALARIRPNLIDPAAADSLLAQGEVALTRSIDSAASHLSGAGTSVGSLIERGGGPASLISTWDSHIGTNLQSATDALAQARLAAQAGDTAAMSQSLVDARTGLTEARTALGFAETGADKAIKPIKYVGVAGAMGLGGYMGLKALTGAMAPPAPTVPEGMTPLTDEAGQPVADAQGNPVYTDAQGNLFLLDPASGQPIQIDQNGNPIGQGTGTTGDPGTGGQVGTGGIQPLADENGQPITDSAGNPVYGDAQGNLFLLDPASGQPIQIDQNGNPIGQGTGTTGDPGTGGQVGTGGIQPLADENGQPITDSAGNPVYGDAQGNLFLLDPTSGQLVAVDANGNPIGQGGTQPNTQVDANGNPIGNAPPTGTTTTGPGTTGTVDPNQPMGDVQIFSISESDLVYGVDYVTGINGNTPSHGFIPMSSIGQAWLDQVILGGSDHAEIGIGYDANGQPYAVDVTAQATSSYGPQPEVGPTGGYGTTGGYATGSGSYGAGGQTNVQAGSVAPPVPAGTGPGSVAAPPGNFSSGSYVDPATIAAQNGYTGYATSS